MNLNRLNMQSVLQVFLALQYWTVVKEETRIIEQLKNRNHMYSCLNDDGINAIFREYIELGFYRVPFY